MEFVMRSTWRPGDCSEVLLNYLDGGKSKEVNACSLMLKKLLGLK
jgi:hypothetical protein